MSIIQRTSFSRASVYSTDNEPTSRIGSTVLIGNDIAIEEKTEETLVAKKELVRRPKRSKAQRITKTVVENKPRKVVKKPQKTVPSQAILPTIVKSQKSLVSSKETSRKFTLRDRFSRNYPLDSPGNRSSVMSVGSNTSVLSRASTSSRRSRTRTSSNKLPTNKSGFWGPYRIFVLKPKKPQTAEIVQNYLTDTYNVQVHIVESSESLNSIRFNTPSDSDSKRALTSILSESDTEIELTVSDQESDVEEPEDKKQSERLRFLEIFGSLPDINNLSASDSVESIQFTKEKEKVLPVVKSDRDQKESDSFADLQVEDEYIEFLDQKTHSLEISSESVIESDEEIYNDIVPEESQDKDISDHLLSIQIRSTIFDDSSSDLFNEIHMTNVAMVEQFLSGLINEVVKYDESTSVRLRRLLDKEKMLEELYLLVIDYQCEMHRNQVLERSVSDYYVRRKEFSLVSDDKQIDTINRERLMSALIELDNRLEQVKLTEELSAKQVKALIEKEAEARALDAQILAKFEAKVRETLCKDELDRITIVVNDLLKKMNKARDETSEVREELLLVQHRLQALKNRSQKLENLGGGLRVLEYISNQARNNALRLKIKEKEIELKRFRDRKTYDVHAMAHLKNKQKINEELLNNMKSKLKTQQKLEKDLRARHYREMVKHDWVKKRILKLKRAGCLMHYPDLLLDYDATVNHVRRKRLMVRKLRQEHLRLEERISEVDTHIKTINKSLRTKLSFASVSLSRLSNKSLSGIRRSGK
ncbi:calponin homology domain-containing protein DDB_G0272472 isoform X1 [Drosophila sechellia]|uniref:calponin homology domain-containing protein DDB_G0272472 isoform X1 n=1 Tax=Drosophila sechellia TaxID=7238 RepID=UPI0013DE6F83|nr:calponin homology domain-containing protein DDB_G0272472 isoform X1 [Drosophila sechellia]